jgi:hypothetical protein
VDGANSAAFFLPFPFPLPLFRFMKFARVVFSVAGVYGLLVLVPQYFLEEKYGRDFPPPVAHPEHYYGFIGVALAWQVLFLVLARDPARYRAMMIPAVLEKLGFGAAAVVLFLLGRVAAPLLAFAAIDLVLAALFVAAYLKTPARREV